MMWLGWASSSLLLFTLAYQVRGQWASHAVAGVSPFLYLGQACASAGFLGYSLWLGNGVFVATNVLLVATALAGLWIHRRNARELGESGNGA